MAGLEQVREQVREQVQAQVPVLVTVTETETVMAMAMAMEQVSGQPLHRRRRSLSFHRTRSWSARAGTLTSAASVRVNFVWSDLSCLGASIKARSVRPYEPPRRNQWKPVVWGARAAQGLFRLRGLEIP